MPVSEHAQEEREAAEKVICFGGKDAGIAFFGRHPHLGWEVAVQTQCDLTRCRELLKRTRMLVLDFRCEGSASPKEVDEVLAAIEEEVL